MTLRIGVVGTGAIGRDHMRRLTAVLPGAAIVAASDPGPGSARAALDAVNPDGTVFDDGHELVAASAVDAVLVTSLGSTHAEYVLAAIAAGKPVFCEKPLATTAADCRRIVDAEVAAAARNGGRRLVQVGFMRPFDAGYRQLRAVLRAGAIGAPLLAHCVHRNVSSPPYWTDDTPIEDSLVHELDALRWLLDDEFASAQVVFPRRASRAPAVLRDPRMVLLETANGVRVDVELFMNCAYGYDIQCE
ncbi:MAG: Gfo/Idh/MocA family oxidoreductase, partial [Gluconacetobacter diazotrophicus]|nr:Gfo/Idh/MocA family oxidoreductase [Gluconacetobacter diazotrophicus]